MIDVYNGYYTFFNYPDYGFVDENGVEYVDSNVEQHVKLCYYALTTLSTIGFGDFLPKSVPEKLMVTFIMISGVTVFSLIMNKFIEILCNYKLIGSVREDRDLTKSEWAQKQHIENHNKQQEQQK